MARITEAGLQTGWGLTAPRREGLVLEPNAASRFHCPIGDTTIAWEEKDVFNPAAAVRDGRIHLLYRAEDRVGAVNGTSRIGLAVSDDGVHFQRDPEPVLYPDMDEMYEYEWPGGCEDPRLVEDEDGRYVLTYTAFDGRIARLCVATSNDLRHWTKHGPVLAGVGMVDQFCKAGAIVCRMKSERLIATQINGCYWMYWLRPGCLFAATSTDLIHWRPAELWGEYRRRLYDREYRLGPFAHEAAQPDEQQLKPVACPRTGRFDNALVEPGPPALLTEAGIVLIYNAWNRMPGGDPSIPDNHYTVGQMLLDSRDPTAVRERQLHPFMQPSEGYEIDNAQLAPCTFVSSLVRFQKQWWSYYGTADRYIGAATFHEGTQ